MEENILKLIGKVKHYAWGGYDFIPQLLGLKKEPHQPSAEYWMGAHASASSLVEIGGKEQVLRTMIEQQPAQYIGQQVNETFGELPYLLKVLDVREMLSIQVHPTKEATAQCFEAEEKAGCR